MGMNIRKKYLKCLIKIKFLKKCLKRHLLTFLLIFSSVFMLNACTSFGSHAYSQKTSNNAQKQRAIQVRIFNNISMKKAMEASVATLQDLNFVVRRADINVGFITATKFSDDKRLQMTVTVQPAEERSVRVRATAQMYDGTIISDPKAYQLFFSNLSRNIFINKNNIN